MIWCCSTLPLTTVGFRKQVSGTVITSSPSQNHPFFRAWLRLSYSTVQITQIPQISVVNREVKPNLSFSIPLGMFNPYSWDTDNKNLREVRRNEQETDSHNRYGKWRTRKNIAPSARLTTSDTINAYPLILIFRTVLFKLEKVFWLPFHHKLATAWNWVHISNKPIITTITAASRMAGRPHFKTVKT